MRTLLLILLIVTAQSITYAGKKKDPCPEPTVENYKRVMSTTFVKEYTQCPVVIEAEFFKDGFPKNLLLPARFKKKYLFQCVNLGDSGSALPLSGEVAGDYFVIDKALADSVLNLKKGDKIRLTGVTFAHSSLAGAFQITPFFLVEKIEVVE